MAGMTGEEKLRRQQEELDEKLSTLSEEGLPTANIIVAGITGAGKSTLINAVFGSELAKTGIGSPVTENINEYHNDDIPVRIWDTVGLELDSEKTARSIASIKETVAQKASAEDQFDRIHAVWYCVGFPSRRYQDSEVAFVKELHSMHLPFIIVLTQCWGRKEEITEFENKIKEKNRQHGLGDINIIRVLATDYKIEIDEDTVVTKPAVGLDALVEETLSRLPEFIKSGFVAAQRVSRGQKREQCENIIYEYAKEAQYGRWDNIPLVKVFTTDRKIMAMFGKIGRMYNTILSEESVNKIMKESGVDFSNNFWGLIMPFDLVGYSDKISNLLSEKKKDGFAVKVEDIPKNNRAARMIAFYGYMFVDSIEELWEKLTEQQLKDVDMVVRNLIGIINDKLKERKAGRRN